ncbi:MAG: DUF2029 domain-containing protein [Candidatus Aminicenantes bacterium]|nr:DUF2029 domain-containing protein [Candidatus Aminicenantes bacterium]
MKGASGKKTHVLIWVLLALLTFYSATLLWNILIQKEKNQWDFQTYYYAAKAHSAGLNPYVLDSLSQAAHKKIRLRFLYPPVTLWFFRLFALLDYSTAYAVYFLLKCLLLFGLVFLWVRVFLGSLCDWLFYFFLLFAFNSAVYVDMVAGNISILEQFLIWLAFFYFLRKKPLPFCLLILLAAFFKTTPVLFLALLIFLPGKKKFAYMVGALTVIGGINLFFYMTQPLFSTYIHYARRKGPGIFSHSTLGFFQDLFGLLKEREILSLPLSLSGLIYYITIAAVLCVTFLTLKRARFGKGLEDHRILIFLACVVYSLILPRFKDYSYVLLIVPTYYVIKKHASSGTAVLLFLIFILSTPLHVNLPGLDAFFTLFWGYYPLVIAYAVWFMCLHILASSKSVSSKESAPA